MTGIRAGLPPVIFFDLDGTLLAPGAVLRRRTIAAVQSAAARGVTIALATGGFGARTRLIAGLLAEGRPGHVWCIAHNGAAIWDPAGRLVHCVPTPPAAIAAVLAAAGPRLWTTFETAGLSEQTHAYYAGRLRPELVHLIWGPQPGDVDAAPSEGVHTGLEPRWDWRRARRAHLEPETNVLGCWCIGTPRALASLDALAPEQTLQGARYLAWGKRLSQILDRPRLQLDGRDVGSIEASKGAAADWLCRQLGVPLADAAAFGDSDNDLDMLERAGTAVAMANATAAARSRAGMIAPSNDEDGVAVVLERWLGHQPLATSHSLQISYTACARRCGAHAGAGGKAGMADEGRPPVWGLWNPFLDDWFNPGTRRPFWLTKDEAELAMPKAQRQYPMGRWEVRVYPLDEPDQAVEGDLGQPPVEPAAPGPA